MGDGYLGRLTVGILDMAFEAIGPLYGERTFGASYVDFTIGRPGVRGPLSVAAYKSGVEILDPRDPENIVPASELELVAHVRQNWIVVESNQSRDHSLVWADFMLYLDPDTWNADYDGKYIRVILPPDFEAIAVELRKRNDVSKRALAPGETLADIQVENLLKGLK